MAGALLDDVAHQSGGRFFEIDNLNELPDVATKIGAALRNQYMLGFAPAMPKRDGKYHKIVVKLGGSQGTRCELVPVRQSHASTQNSDIGPHAPATLQAHARFGRVSWGLRR